MKEIKIKIGLMWRAGLSAVAVGLMMSLSGSDVRAQGAWVANPNTGRGIDRRDYSYFLCSDSADDLGSIPPEGQVSVTPVNTGGIIAEQKADGNVCKDGRHPLGAKHAKFVVFDSNPDASPGFSVSGKQVGILAKTGGGKMWLLGG